MPAINPWLLLYSIRSVNKWNEVINSNIAASTRVGYKESDFMFGGGATQITGYGQTAEQYLSLASTLVNFNQGSITHSNDWTNTAINGQGFFMTTDNIINPTIDDIHFTRDGQFYTDSAGLLRTDEGLYVLDGTQMPGDPDPASNWIPPWAGDANFGAWTDRQKLRVKNTKDHDLTAGTVVGLSVDTAALVSAGKLQGNIGDMRLGYYDWSTLSWSTVDFEVVPGTENTVDTKIRFRLKADLPQGASITDQYFLFDKGPGGSTLPAPVVPISLVDPDGLLDNFAGVFNPLTDGGSTSTGINSPSPEDWAKEVASAGNYWKVGLPDSPSDGWAGLAAGNISYIKGYGYTFNTGSQEIYRRANASRPGGFEFVDNTGTEITMKTINGTNFGGTVSPDYNFKIDGSGNGAYALDDPDPTHRQWERFNPNTVVNLPPLDFNNGFTFNYDSFLNGWGTTPYQDGGGIVPGDSSNTAWQGTPTNSNYEYFLIRQPIKISQEGVIRQGGGIDLSGFVNKDVTVVLRDNTNTPTVLYPPAAPNGNLFNASFIPYTDLPPGTSYIEVYATRDVSNTTPNRILLDTNSWPGYKAGEITYVNGQGYSFNPSGEALYLEVSYSTSPPTYKVVKADGSEPTMEILTDIKQETASMQQFGQSNLGTLSAGAEYGTTGWYNRTGIDLTVNADGNGYWSNLSDSYGYSVNTVPNPDVVHPGGGEVHLTNTMQFSRDLIEAPATTTENVTISGSIYGNDGWTLGYMEGDYRGFLPYNNSPTTGNWNDSGGYGNTATFANTPYSTDPDYERVYSAGGNLNNTGGLYGVNGEGNFTAASQTTTAFSSTASTSTFNEKSTFLLSGLTGEVGQIKFDQTAFEEQCDWPPGFDSVFNPFTGTEYAGNTWTVNVISPLPNTDGITWNYTSTNYDISTYPPSPPNPAADPTWMHSFHYGRADDSNYISQKEYITSFESGMASTGGAGNWSVSSTNGNPDAEWRLSTNTANSATHSAYVGNAAGTSYDVTKTIINEGFEGGIPGSWTINSITGNPTVQWRTSSNTASAGSASAYFGNAAGTDYSLGADAATTLDVYMNWNPTSDMDMHVLEPDGVDVYYNNKTHYGLYLHDDLTGGANYAMPAGFTGVWDEHYVVNVAAPAAAALGTTMLGNYAVSVVPFSGSSVVTFTVIEDVGSARGGVFNTSGTANVTSTTTIGTFTVGAPKNVKGELITPKIDLTNMGNGVVTFKDSFATEALSAFDTKKVYIFDGTTWTDITAAVSVGGGGSQGWTSHTYNIPASYDGNANVKFKFEFDSVDGRQNAFRGWNIDEFRVTAKSPVKSALISPTFDMSGTVNDRLEFFDSYDTETTNPVRDSKTIYVWNGITSAWDTLDTRGDNNNGDPSYSSRTFAAGMTTIAIPPALQGRSDIKIKFEFDTTDSTDNTHRGWNVDDIRVVGERQTKAELISPYFDLTDYINAELDYSDYFRTDANVTKDLKEIWMSSNNGVVGSWIKVREENAFIEGYESAIPEPDYSGTQNWLAHPGATPPASGIYPVPITVPPAILDNPKVRLKFVFDSVDGDQNGFSGWNVDSIKVVGDREIGRQTTWAGGAVGGGSINSDPINVVGRTIGATNSVTRYYVGTDTDGALKIFDKFGDGQDGNFGHTGGSTQKSNLNTTPNDADDFKLFDYAPDATNVNEQVRVYTIDNSKGLRINDTATSKSEHLRDGTTSNNGIQSIDAFQTLARYYIDASGNVFDRFGLGTLATSDNTYMTSNDDNVADEFGLGVDDEHLIDYDPKTSGTIVDNKNNVPLYTNPMLVQTGTVGNETRIRVAGTGENVGTGDGNQYADSENWNQYQMEVNFGVSNPLATGDTSIYIRQQDATHWVRLRYDHTAGKAYLESQSGGAINNQGTVDYKMLDPVSTGGLAKIIAEGENIQVYLDNVPVFEKRIPGCTLYGPPAVGTTRTSWYQNLTISPLNLLQATFIGSGIMAPTGPDDILDQMYLCLFPDQQGLKYDSSYGSTYFQQTVPSGIYKAEKAGRNGAGELNVYSLEQSNVNMARQLSGLATSKNIYDVLMKQMLIFQQQFDIGLNLLR